jgi:S1-C subfamily serine protease
MDQEITNCSEEALLNWRLSKMSFRWKFLKTVVSLALIPPYFLDCVVAIGRMAPISEGGKPVLENGHAKEQWDPLASGFLYGEFTGEKDKDSKNLYRVFLVTNRHVFQGSSKLTLRFNPREAKPAKEYNLDLLKPDGKPQWFTPADTSVDAAVIAVDMALLRKDGIRAEFFAGDTMAADTVKAKDIGVTEGDGAFVLGFPLKLVGGERNFVIVRQGGIARISDTLSGSNKTFLLDTFIFPGNSGGPVILRPELTAIANTKSQNQALLIGLVSSFQTYEEVAISQQTGRPRVVFEENAGLANVVPVDYIKQAIAESIKAEKVK